MLPKPDASASQGTLSVKKKRRKRLLYYSSKKDLEKSRMRSANKEFIFRRPSKLLDFRNANVADIAGVTDNVRLAVQEVEEGMISIIYKEECANEVILCPASQTRYHIVHVQF
jgi:hypothetical protein